MTMSAVDELERRLVEERSELTLPERVRMRIRIDELNGVVYPPVSPRRMLRVARIVQHELPRIIRRGGVE